jgi:hypothetical protein
MNVPVSLFNIWQAEQSFLGHFLHVARKWRWVLWDGLNCSLDLFSVEELFCIEGATASDWAV